MKHICLSIIAALTAWVAIHAETDFERACANLTEESLPQINLTINVAQMSKENYIDGHIDVADPLARTTGEVMCSFDCRMRWRGESSLYYAKKSLAVKTVDSEGNGLDVNMLGIRNEDSWILDAMACDRLRMRNRVLFDLWNETNRTPWETDYDRRNGTLGHFVELYFNGAYQGLYCLTDKIDRKLLGLKKAKVDDEGNVTVRGLQYKCEKHSQASYFESYDAAPVDTIAWNGWELKVPEDYPSLATWQPLMDVIDTCRLPVERLTQVYEDVFYRDNLIDYMVFVMAFRISDNSMKNSYLSAVDITKDKHYVVTPWDLDASMGNRYDGYWLNKLTEWRFLSAVSLYRKLYLYDETLDFQQAFRHRWAQLRNTTFSHKNLVDKMDAYAAQMTASGAWQREVGKWNNNPVSLLPDVADEVAIVAEWYTREIEEMNRLMETPWGDVNIDGVVNGGDVTALYSILFDTEGQSDAVGDVNGDGVVNGGDVTALYNLLLADE